MANAASAVLRTTASPYAPPETKAAYATAEEPTRSADAAVVRQLVGQLSDSVNASLRQVAAQFGVADAIQDNVPEDARVVVQELAKARRKEKELQLLVDDLQTEQRVARERLALYSILALKLKRELINEKLAHIDSKKEVEEIRQQYERDASSSVGMRSPDASDRLRHLQQGQQHEQRRGSYESLRGHSAGEDDPWSSPNRPTGSDKSSAAVVTGAGTSGSNLQLSFGSFYSRQQERAGDDNGDDDDDGADEDERAQSLRNSLIGQFLPSTLLDSPQLTPTARSGGPSGDNQGGDFGDDPQESKSSADEDTTSKEKSVSAQLDQELASFTLGGSDISGSKDRCDACGRSRAPVVEVVDCGHRLCRPCDRLVSAMDDPSSPSTTTAQCPRCHKMVVALRRLDAAATKDDNQVEHLRIETSRPSSSDSTATAVSSFATTTTSSIAPLTLSLLSEMFENISTDELEQFLKEANGQVSGAIERILHRHPSFNPALAAEVSVTAGPGAGASGQKGGSGPGAVHRSVSSGIPSHQQQSQQQSGGAAGGNWKTEMCMYYLQGKCNKTRRTCSFAHGESDLVRTNTPKHTSSTSYKSRLCPQWLEGSCPKSRRECPLAHGENDLRDGLALLSQNPATGGGAGGTGSIPPTVLPTTAPRLQNYKTELCYYYLKGCCNFTKEECRFAHGESDLRTVESNTLEWSAQLSGAATEKASLQLQHQYQQQFVPQYQSQQQQQPQQQAMPPQYGLAPLPPPFVPQAHQYHQMAPPPMHPHQLQAPVPPGHQQGQYAPPQYRYLKSMDDAKPPRRPAPPRRESTWSQPNYDSMGSDF